MTPERYIEILRTHGRRVANRVVLSTMPAVGRSLADFYMCYGHEDDLPEEEQCSTGMIAMFDPAGWMVYYETPVYSLWPEPPKSEPT